MFRGLLSLSAGLLALLCVTGIPGQLSAKGPRFGMMRPAVTPQMGRTTPLNQPFINPGFGRLNPAAAQFLLLDEFRLRQGIPGFDPLSIDPRLRALDRRLIDPRLRGF
jgi:hypothetical protein